MREKVHYGEKTKISKYVLEFFFSNIIVIIQYNDIQRQNKTNRQQKQCITQQKTTNTTPYPATVAPRTEAALPLWIATATR